MGRVRSTLVVRATLVEAGTSDGAKKGWETRRGGGSDKSEMVTLYHGTMRPDIRKMLKSGFRPKKQMGWGSAQGKPKVFFVKDLNDASRYAYKGEGLGIKGAVIKVQLPKSMVKPLKLKGVTHKVQQYVVQGNVPAKYIVSVHHPDSGREISRGKI